MNQRLPAVSGRSARAAAPPVRVDRFLTVLRAASRPALVALIALGVVVPPAAAQEYDLFDKFAVTLSASWGSYNTKARLDPSGRVGSEIDFEDLLGLDSSKTVPTVRFDWQMKRRQRLYLYWASHERSSQATASTEIVYGDLVIPVNAVVSSEFDFTDIRLGYAYYVVMKDRSAFAVTGGLRRLDYTGRLAVDLDVGGGQIQRDTEEGQTAGPFPFFGVEWRYALAPKWRFVSEFGYFQLEVGDYDGSQLILDGRVEHLVTRRFAWGLRGALSQVDLDVQYDRAHGKVDQDIAAAEIFARVRW